jgi:hypothetical protein
MCDLCDWVRASTAVRLGRGLDSRIEGGPAGFGGGSAIGEGASIPKVPFLDPISRYEPLIFLKDHHQATLSGFGLLIRPFSGSLRRNPQNKRAATTNSPVN